MKKTLILLLMFLLFQTGYSQLIKGSFLGSFTTGFAYNHYKYKLTNYSSNGDLVYETNSLDFTLNSSIGYFVANHLVIGPGIYIGTEYIQYSDEFSGASYKTHSTVYSVAFNPFTRYYFAEQRKLAFFVQLNGSVGYGQNFYT